MKLSPPSIALVLLFTYVTLHGLWTIFHWGGDEVAAGIAGLPGTISAIAATIAAAWRTNRATNPQLKRGWATLTIALALYSAASMLWGYHTVVHQQIPFPTIADVAFLVFPLLIFVALTQLTRSQLSPVTRTRVILNTLIMVCSVGLLEWSLVMRHAVHQADSTLAALAAVLYPLGDLVMLGGVVFTLQHAWSAEQRAFLIPLLIAVGLFLFGNAIYAVEIVTGSYRPASPLDITWSLGLAFFALAALRPIPTTPVSGSVQSQAERTSTKVILVLRLAAYAALIPLMVNSATPLLDTLVAVTLLLGMGVLIYLRQQLDTHENSNLNRSLQTANAQLQQRVQEGVSALRARNMDLQQQNKEIQTSSDLADLLQACLTLDEARDVLVKAAGQLFPGMSGSIATINGSRNLIETFAVWGNGPQYHQGQVFAPQECWALRRGHPHVLEGNGERLSVACKQLCDHVPGSYLCLPLVAQGGTVGVLRISSDTASPGRAEDLQATAQGLGRQVALALANLQLRESLRRQSIRDSLTGLHNRRYLDETLEREVRRAKRSLVPLSVLVLDVDHFKTFNDSFGHDAGDLVLQELARTMQRVFREEDIVCRYGGEEFVVVLLDADADMAVIRAEQLREVVQQMQLTFRNQALPSVTVSVGVTSLRENQATPEELIRAADQALYQAKREGRNCVALAETPTTRN